MLQAIVQFSLRLRGIVVSLACLALAYGIFVATHAKLDVFPDFVPPEVTWDPLESTCRHASLSIL